MKVNWLVRIKNKTFWLSIIPALVLLVEVGASIFGFDMDFGDIGNKVISFVNVLFSVLVIMGIVNDPTTKGLGDSTQALAYTAPKVEEIV